MRDPGEIADVLADIARLITLSGKDAFRARAYERGAELVRALGPELARLVLEDRLEAVEGIGPSLRKQIVELWQSGRSSQLDKVCTELPAGALELSRVPALTLKRMRALGEGLGVRSLGDLREVVASGALLGLAGFGPKLVERIGDELAALGQVESVHKALILGDARELAARIAESALVRGVAVHATGALRRGAETLECLELLVVAEDRTTAFGAVAAAPGVAHLDMERGQGVLARGLPLSLHYATPAGSALALWTSTGPEQHVRKVAEHAASGGVLAALAGASIRDEDELYQRLGLASVPPELRGLDDALPRAERGEFAALVRAEDVRGMVHCHTLYSDGKHSVLDMARAAHALGMKYITITDHSPTAGYANGVGLDRLKRQWDDIAAAEAEVPIRIFRGTESDIVEDGSLDYPDAVLEQFDVVIASIHARHKMGRAEMTARLVRAMSLPIFKIWGHALGRLLLSREPIECDLPRVLDALAASRGAVELSGDPHRLDLPPEHIPLARERSIPFVISVDAHSVDGFQALPLGVTMARRGGVTRHEVLNTLDAEAFAARVRP